MDAVITLVTETYTKDAEGVNQVTETTTDVFCKVRSVSRADFYSAGELGLALSYVFITNPVNYSGQKVLVFGGERYAVVRTYQPSLDVLEIYAGYKVGVDGGRSDSGS